jgi:hypothetical protein
MGVTKLTLREHCGEELRAGKEVADAREVRALTSAAARPRRSSGRRRGWAGGRRRRSSSGGADGRSGARRVIDAELSRMHLRLQANGRRAGRRSPRSDTSHAALSPRHGQGGASAARRANRGLAARAGGALSHRGEDRGQGRHYAALRRQDGPKCFPWVPPE